MGSSDENDGSDDENGAPTKASGSDDEHGAPKDKQGGSDDAPHLGGRPERSTSPDRVHLCEYGLDQHQKLVHDHGDDRHVHGDQSQKRRERD